jgi:very-short-patch-repair endonuclease
MGPLKSVTSMPKDAQVAWIAARQHGAIGHAQLVDVGLSQTEIRRRVAAGWLHRLHVGVFAVGHPGLTAHGRWAAATLGGGRDAVLSHRSAAALWGIGLDGAIPSITVPGAKRRGTDSLEVHAGRLRPDEIVTYDAIRVTSVGRTLLDLAETVTVKELVAVIDNATNARRLGRTTMSSVINGATGRRGVRPLKQALLITRPQDVLTRSELERRALKLIRRAGLAAPEVNVRLHGRERDLLWRAARLVVELDGRAYHDPERDTRRDADLLARGFATLRFTWRQVVNDPDWVTDRLATVLHDRAAR